jgi:predicted RNase H-like HicB family nuclease
MALAYFTAILEKAEDGYCVFFPDVDGCTSAGDTIAEAVQNATEALATHFELTAEAGEPLPTPRPPEAVTIDSDIVEAARMLIPVELPGRAVRVNISMEEGLLNRLDQAAKASSLTRSGLIADAVRSALGAPGGGH